MIKTSIRKTENGHQVSFTIGHQTFFLQEQEGEEGLTSMEHAKWYEKQLKTAFKNLAKQPPNKHHPETCDNCGSKNITKDDVFRCENCSTFYDKNGQLI